MSDVPARLAAALAGRYRLERELGQGGMATVYLAEDLKHDRKVAIKVLKPELAAVLGAERFVQEIKTTAALQHPNILPLHDSGEADGLLFYVMPYVEGESLRDKLDRDKQLGLDEALKITTEVADALQYAHEHGVVHRDIKPENILMHAGRPMVADFGIALAVSAAAGGRMTETGLSLGTPHYMSPEQATAEKDITGRSDVYSLASVLYEMLTGDPPHTGKTAQQVIAKIIAEDAVPVTKLRKSVPPNVAAATAKALEKLPADRFDSAKAFADALANPSFTAPSATSATLPHSHTATYLLAAACIVFAAAAAYFAFRPRPEPPVVSYALALTGEATPAWDGFVTGNHDGSVLIYQGSPDPAGTARLWMKRRGTVDVVPLAGTDGATAAALSPDGQTLAFVRPPDLVTMPLAGGPATLLAHDASNVGGAVTWLADGTIVYVTQDSGGDAHVIQRIAANGGSPTVVWRSDTADARVLTPIPGARGITFQTCAHNCTNRTSRLWATRLADDSTRLLEAASRAGYVTANGYLIYVTNAQVAMAVPFDLSSLTVTGTPRAVLDTVSSGLGTSPYLWVAPDGSTLAMQRGTTGEYALYQFVWVDSTGRVTPVDTVTRFRVTERAAEYGWKLSPDDHQVVVGVHSASGDQIWIKSLPHGPMSKVTSRTSFRPHWRPDGAHVVFVSDSGVYVTRADGTGTDSLIWRGTFDEGTLSPDGRWLLVRTGASGPNAGGRNILGARLGVDTALQPVVATPSDEMAIALSPNGTWLAYQSDETGRLEIYVRPFPVTPAGGRIQVSVRGGTGPLWSRNGRRLYYLRSDGTMMAAAWPPAPDGHISARALFHPAPGLTDGWITARYTTPWDVSADGRFLMLQRVGGSTARGSPLIVIRNWNRELRTLLAQ